MNPLTIEEHCESLRLQIAELGIAMAAREGRFEVYFWDAGDGVERRYSITYAKVCIEVLKIEAQPWLTPDLVKQVMGYNPRVKELAPDWVAKADLSKPIIQMIRETPEGPRHIIIDGWHRIRKAVETNHPGNLSCYVLPQHIAELCRV